ncbi:hypothetical protein FKM82_004003 [Ascaphus truei]
MFLCCCIKLALFIIFSLAIVICCLLCVQFCLVSVLFVLFSVHYDLFLCLIPHIPGSTAVGSSNHQAFNSVSATPLHIGLSKTICMDIRRRIKQILCGGEEPTGTYCIVRKIAGFVGAKQNVHRRRWLSWIEAGGPRN